MTAFYLADSLTPEHLGEAIRQARKQQGVTLETLEKVTGISKKTLIKLEKGGDARFSTLSTVLSYLGLRLRIVHGNDQSLGSRPEDFDGWF